MEQAWVGDLIRHWRDDNAGTYRTWFLWDTRIKNFRSIRRGPREVIAEIKADTFGNAYRGFDGDTHPVRGSNRPGASPGIETG